MMRIVDVVLSVPLLFLLIALAVIFHPSLELLICRDRVHLAGSCPRGSCAARP